MTIPRLWKILANPFALGVILLLIGGAVLAIDTAARIFFVLGLLLAYVAISTAALVVEPNWWVRAIVTLLMGPIVMFGLIYTAEAYQERSVGEGALALLGPLMLHWVLIPVSGLVKLVMRNVSRPADAAAAPQPPRGSSPAA